MDKEGEIERAPERGLWWGTTMGEAERGGEIDLRKQQEEGVMGQTPFR